MGPSMQELSRRSRSGDCSIGGEARCKVACHRSRSRVASWLRDRLRNHRIGRVRRTILDASYTGTVCTLTLHDGPVALGPHIHVAQMDVDARSAIRADELDGWTLHTINDIAVPVLTTVKVSRATRVYRRQQGRTENVMFWSCTPAPCPGVWDDQNWLMLRPYAVPRETKFWNWTFLT